ncbi:PREDICTED: DNA repair protein XRCC4 [Nanorana parkeri]|uniref:DNA repair protein XRCC4 n=1 Tax=Nanorana parkeri TaxID=125878 RepID=UPI00085458E5|nr:PREDICTED: DNA repair protein XRCC4 [Nanorana parkeri]
MEKTVQKIAIASNPGGTYFLQIGWEEDLDKGFTVTLCDGQTALTGEVSTEDVSREAADIEMEKAKYVDELNKALISATLPASKYSFDLVKDEKDYDTYCFTYEKKLRDVSFKLGSLQLKNVKEPAEIIKDLINYCLTTTTELHSKNEHLQKENERLQRDWVDMQEQMEKFVSSKEELEQDLYTRFTCVLNEKKAKIRSLNEKLSRGQTKASEESNSSIPFDTVPVSDIKNDDYDASTDEDSKSPELTIKAAPPPLSRRRSLVHSPDDSPDVAPSRKRRQRGQKMSYAELKEKATKPEDIRCKAASSKTTGKNPSSENLPLPTSKTTPDPDDLFSDI